MPTITVRGTASVPAEPDEATVALTVSALEDSPEAAYNEVAERSLRLERVYDELGVARAQRSTAGVSVQPEFEWVEGQQALRGYRATARTSVRIREAKVAATLLQQAVSRAQADVHGPWWTVALDNPARLEACRRAASTARAKAEAYAQSLGLALGALEQAAEPGAVRPALAGGVALRAMAADTAEVPVDPGEQQVGASIDLTFALAEA